MTLTSFRVIWIIRIIINVPHHHGTVGHNMEFEQILNRCLANSHLVLRHVSMTKRGDAPAEREAKSSRVHTLRPCDGTPTYRLNP